jgi:hypothetical protein
MPARPRHQRPRPRTRRTDRGRDAAPAAAVLANAAERCPDSVPVAARTSVSADEPQPVRASAAAPGGTAVRAVHARSRHRHPRPSDERSGSRNRSGAPVGRPEQPDVQVRERRVRQPEACAGRRRRVRLTDTRRSERRRRALPRGKRRSDRDTPRPRLRQARSALAPRALGRARAGSRSLSVPCTVPSRYGAQDRPIAR